MIHKCLKFTSLLLVSSWLRGRVLDWRLSQPGFDPSFWITLMSSDRTKQICLWMTIYIYIYNQVKLRAQSFLTISCHPSIPIISSWQVIKAASCVHTELMYVSLSWSAYIGTSMCKSLLENITYEFVLTSLAVLCMSCSSYLNGL